MLNIKKHRHVLFELITDIYRSSLANYLGFKGGTMAYFFYGLDRFSVDLDFDLLDEKKKNTVFTQIPEILQKHGVIKEQTDKKFTLFFLLNYEKTNRNIKVEISKRKTTEVDYISANFYGTDVRISKIEDALATKLLACTTRNRIAYRDFYDVYFYLKKGIIPNEEIIKKISNKSLKEYLVYLIQFTQKNINSRLILTGIGELVNEKQKAWIRGKFKSELINRLTYLTDQSRQPA